LGTLLPTTTLATASAPPSIALAAAPPSIAAPVIAGEPHEVAIYNSIRIPVDTIREILTEVFFLERPDMQEQIKRELIDLCKDLSKPTPAPVSTTAEQKRDIADALTSFHEFIPIGHEKRAYTETWKHFNFKRMIEQSIATNRVEGRKFLVRRLNAFRILLQIKNKIVAHYWEPQETNLCGQHSINHLLQEDKVVFLPNFKMHKLIDKSTRLPIADARTIMDPTVQINMGFNTYVYDDQTGLFSFQGLSGVLQELNYRSDSKKDIEPEMVRLMDLDHNMDFLLGIIYNLSSAHFTVTSRESRRSCPSVDVPYQYLDSIMHEFTGGCGDFRLPIGAPYLKDSSKVQMTTITYMCEGSYQSYAVRSKLAKGIVPEPCVREVSCNFSPGDVVRKAGQTFIVIEIERSDPLPHPRYDFDGKICTKFYIINLSINLADPLVYFQLEYADIDGYDLIDSSSLEGSPHEYYTFTKSLLEKHAYEKTTLPVLFQFSTNYIAHLLNLQFNKDTRLEELTDILREAGLPSERAYQLIKEVYDTTELLRVAALNPRPLPKHVKIAIAGQPKSRHPGSTPTLQQLIDTFVGSSNKVIINFYRAKGISDDIILRYFIGWIRTSWAMKANLRPLFDEYAANKGTAINVGGTKYQYVIPKKSGMPNVHNKDVIKAMGLTLSESAAHASGASGASGGPGGPGGPKGPGGAGGPSIPAPLSSLATTGVGRPSPAAALATASKRMTKPDIIKAIMNYPGKHQWFTTEDATKLANSYVGRTENNVGARIVDYFAEGGIRRTRRKRSHQTRRNHRKTRRH